MTLVISIASQNAIYMVTDRRLTVGPGRYASHLATKLLQIDTINSVGLVGYFGIGAKSAPFREVSTWIRNSLRGAKCDYDTTLALIAGAGVRRIRPWELHGFVSVAFVEHIPVISHLMNDGVLQFDYFNVGSENMGIHKTGFLFTVYHYLPNTLLPFLQWEAVPYILPMRQR